MPPTTAPAPSAPPAPVPVSYDRRSFILRGKPFFILSGAVHYVRVHPTRWPALFATFRAASLNTLETYVFWGDHEAASPHPTPDPTNPPPPCFTGRHDLFAFIDAAAAAGLAVILRLGPYVCAESDFGGLPARLRDVPNLVLRTWNRAFMTEMERWLRLVVSTLHARNQLASAGGPVILVQLENEYDMVSSAYGSAGTRYLQWAADLRDTLGLDVPAIMCVGAADGVVETINAFYAHREVAALRARHADQPPVWTECWAGWYDVWGAPHNLRPAHDLLYAVARFVAAGGAGINYYMWMGGTNFGPSTMYLQKTSYDYDAPVDEYYAMTDKARLLARLHDSLIRHFLPVFHASRDKDPVFIPVNRNHEHDNDHADDDEANVTVVQWGHLAFLCNDNLDRFCPPNTLILPQTGPTSYPHPLKPRSLHLIDMSVPHAPTLLFDTASPLPDSQRFSRAPVPARGLCAHLPIWARMTEPLPRPCDTTASARSLYGDRPVVVADEPAELVSLVRRRSDYAFYATRLRLHSPNHTLTGTPTGAAAARADGDAVEECVLQFEAADYAQLFIHGARVGASATPLWEDRWPNRWNGYADGTYPGTRVEICLPASVTRVATEAEDGVAEVEVCIAVASLGLVKADWQLAPGCNMRDERKGLLSEVRCVRVGGGGGEGEGEGEEGRWTCTRITQWTSVGGTHGETKGLFETLGAENEDGTTRSGNNADGNADGREVGHSGAGAGAGKGEAGKGEAETGPAWFGCTMRATRSHEWALDLGGIGKGLFYVNGVLLGRFWDVVGTRPLNGFLKASPIQQTGVGEPSQRWYHVPQWVLDSGGDEKIEKEKKADEKDVKDNDNGKDNVKVNDNINDNNSDSKEEECALLHVVLFVERGRGPGEGEGVRLVEMRATRDVDV